MYFLLICFNITFSVFDKREGKNLKQISGNRAKKLNVKCKHVNDTHLFLNRSLISQLSVVDSFIWKGKQTIFTTRNSNVHMPF